MSPRAVVVACAACAVAGALVGVAIGRARGDGGGETSPAALAAGQPGGEPTSSSSSRSDDRRPDPASRAPGRAEPSRAALDELRRRSSERAAHGREPAASPSEPDPEPAVETDEAPHQELERLRKEVVELRDERREVMGEPVEPPADLEPRFRGSTMSTAIQSALAQANVPGAVEGTDCSEHPCIVFGRLEGDEEDMEEVERAAALSEYDGDVLTLLFWATSVEEPGASPAETGLFALAFYSFEDRAERGEALDRRIRARTMEFWNHDRPGRGTPVDP